MKKDECRIEMPVGPRICACGSRVKNNSFIIYITDASNHVRHVQLNFALSSILRPSTQ